MIFYTIFVPITIFMGSVIGLPAKFRTSEPERCCMPEQFSGRVSGSYGAQLPGDLSFGSYGFYNFSQDSKRGIIGMRGVAFSSLDEGISNVRLIEDMNNGRMYTIDQDRGRCDKVKSPIKPFRCIPDSAIYIHSSKYGYDDKQIIGDTWLVIGDNGITYTTVSRDGHCVPMTAYTFVTDPPSMGASTMTDFEQKVNDPTIFDIPAECEADT